LALVSGKKPIEHGTAEEPDRGETQEARSISKELNDEARAYRTGRRADPRRGSSKTLGQVVPAGASDHERHHDADGRGGEAIQQLRRHENPGIGDE
jgi:hypothetical protein